MTDSGFHAYFWRLWFLGGLSIKWTSPYSGHQWCPVYKDSTVASSKTCWVQPKTLALIINFFALNFASIEIEGERVSSSQDECTLRLEGGWGVLENVQAKTRGRRAGQNSGILSECPFWISPNTSRKRPTVRSNRSQVFYNIGILKESAKFTQKQQCWSHFWRKPPDIRRLQRKFFPENFANH